MTDEEQIKAAVAFAKEKFGRLDSLICNAGFAIVGTVEEVNSVNLNREASIVRAACRIVY